MICPHCQAPMKATTDRSGRRPRPIWLCFACNVAFDRKTESDLKIPGIDPGPATKKRPTPHEHNEQCMLFKAIRMYEERHPVLKNVFAIPNGGWRHKQVAGGMWAEGVRPGVPDIFCAAPYLWAGTCHGLWIELKVRGGKVSDHQREWHERLEQAGYKVVVCYGWEEAWTELVNYLRLPKEIDQRRVAK